MKTPHSFLGNAMLRHWHFGAFLAGWIAVGPVSIQAANWSWLLFELTGSGKAAKETAYAAEDAMRLAKEGDVTSEAVAREARQMGVEAANRVALRQMLSNALRTKGANASTLLLVNDLAEADVDAGIVYLRGGRRLKEAVPDVLTRARLTQQGGAPAIAALGLSDTVPVEDFLKLDAMISAGKIPSEVAGKPALARLGELLANGSAGFSTFYRRYIRGKEVKWAACGALAWWMTDPDSFQDAAGNLTEAGFRRLTELAGKVAASGLRGAAEGGKTAGKEVATAVIDGYFRGAYVWAAWLALALFVYLGGIILPATRPFLLRPIFRLFRPRL